MEVVYEVPIRFRASSRTALKESWASMWYSPGVVLHAKSHSLKVITKFKRNCQFNSLKLHKENPIKKKKNRAIFS